MASDVVDQDQDLRELVRALDNIAEEQVDVVVAILKRMLWDSEHSTRRPQVTRFGCDRCGLLWEEDEPQGTMRYRVFRGICPRCRRAGQERT